MFLRARGPGAGSSRTGLGVVGAGMPAGRQNRSVGDVLDKSPGRPYCRRLGEDVAPMPAAKGCGKAVTSRRKALLLVNNALGVGGVETVVRDIARLAQEWGVETRIVLPLRAEIIDPPADVVQLPQGPGGWVLGMRRLVASLPPDSLIHSHHRRFSLLSEIARRSLPSGRRAGMVEHVHNVYSDKKLLSFKSPLLVAAGSGIASMLVEDYGRPAASIRVLLNSARRVTRTESFPEGVGRTVVGIGRLAPEKEPLLWAEVVSELNRRVPGGVNGVWFGDGPLAPECRSAYDAPFLSWRGNVRSIPDALHESKPAVLLSVSTREALPISVLEALGAGIPVVARHVGSLADAVIHGTTGTLLPFDASFEQFVDAAAEILSSESIRESMSREARAHYAKNFTPDAFATGLRRIYEEVGLV
jgi:glycosyltransferase involved in cell wall biosynthesis